MTDSFENEGVVEDAPVAESNEIVVTLSSPIPVFAEMRSVITMRKPTGLDLIKVGNPVQFDPVSDPPRIEHNMPRMVAMIARLANIPTGSVEKMDPRDLASCAWQLSSFFLPKT